MHLKTRIFTLFFCCILLLGCAGCGNTAPSSAAGSGSAEFSESPLESDEINQILYGMTLEEKVAQLFLVQPEAIVDVDTVVSAGKATKAAINAVPVGGFVYFSDNFQSERQTRDMLTNVQKYSLRRIGLPAFLSVDEEGGTVARIANSDAFNIENVGDMADIGSSWNIDLAYDAGKQIGSYLSNLGFNLDFAPVADVLSNPDNTVVKKRSFSSNPYLVSEMAMSVSKGLKKRGIYSVFKHFPGHGATTGDTHEGYAYTDKTLQELQQCELIPFQRCVDEKVPFIMVGHISVPNVIGDTTPASLSEKVIGEILREQMGYDGIVITDAMNMGAIAEQYDSSDAAVKAIQAGADIILMPEDFQAAYQGILTAVKKGEISEERIELSVRRIIDIKLKIMK